MNLTRGTVVWPAVDPKAGRWLWGERNDLFWVAGLGSLLFALAAVPISLAVPAASMAFVVAFQHLGAVCNQPHYAVTYDLIVRERARAKSSYTWLLASTPIALALVAYAAFAQTSLIGILNRAYLTWSAYHYAAQHFGIASMYQARDKRPFAPREKRAVQVAFVAMAGYLIVLLNMKGGLGATALFGNDRAAVFETMLPSSVYPVAVVLALVGFVAYGLGEAWHARRTGKGLGREARLLFATNVAWFVLPYVHLPGADGPWTGKAVGTWLPYALPFFHCAQYLGVCGWRARTTGPVKPIYDFMKLVGLGFLLFQGIAFAIGFAAGLGEDEAVVLVVAVVNIHHFFLDGLMWKARRRPSTPAGQQPVAPPGAKSEQAAA